MCLFAFARIYSQPGEKQLRWVNELHINNTSVNWRVVYDNNFHCTLESKLKSFQIKLNHRAVVINVQLHGFGLVDSNLCIFCNLHPETLVHLFFSCDYVNK